MNSHTGDRRKNQTQKIGQCSKIPDPVNGRAYSLDVPSLSLSVVQRDLLRQSRSTGWRVLGSSFVLGYSRDRVGLLGCEKGTELKPVVFVLRCHPALG